jgi:hypothetical protein
MPTKRRRQPLVHMHKRRLIGGVLFAEIVAGLRCAMNWVKERDLLVAQTMTFVQSITGKKPEAETRAEARVEFAPVDEIERVDRPVEIVRPKRPSPVPRSGLREEIQGRVAAFRAHQQLFDRERDAYFNSVLNKVRASTGSPPKASRN